MTQHSVMSVEVCWSQGWQAGCQGFNNNNNNNNKGSNQAHDTLCIKLKHKTLSAFFTYSGIGFYNY